LRAGTDQEKEWSTAESGFTLLEACIALVLLLFMALAVTSLFIFAINNNNNAGDRAMAVAVAQQQLERLRSVSFSEMETTANPSGSTSKTVTAGERSYLVTTTFSYTPSSTSPTLKTVTINVKPQAASTLWTNSPVIVVMQRTTLETGSYSR
jgi:Tfp pilus assembly protein PilV